MSDGGARTVSGPGWACQGCGFCCRFHHLGPLDAATVQRLSDSRPQDWAPAAARDGWLDTRMGTTGPVHALKKVDGHCVFLRDDLLCAVHATLGADAKPGFCRLFPYQVVEDADGFAVSLRDSCAGLHHGGPALDVAGAVALARAYGAVDRFAPETVDLLPGVAVDGATWAARERALVDWLAQAPDLAPGALVAALRDRLADLLPPLPTPDPARATLATRAVLHALDLTLQQVAQQEAAPSAADAAFSDELHMVVRDAGTALADGHTPVLDAAGRAFVRDRLAHALLGKALHRSGPVALGIGRLLVPVTAAAVVAPAVPGQPPALDDLARVHAHLVRFTQNRSVDVVLRKAGPALVDLFLHAS